MIGDWVFINNVPHKIQAIDNIDAEIRADDEVYYVGEDRYHSEDKVKGIKITPEILEKNGFKFENDSEFQISSERLLPDNTYIYIRFHKIENCHIVLSYRGMEDFELNIHIRYVHQLQHAFRLSGLSGLNVLADNFKI